MKKKWVRITVITLSSIVLMLVLANFGMNYWLQNNLPNYLKENTEYKINYADINVELGTGNILLTKIAVQNKNIYNTEIIGLSGKIDTLQISRLGIYNAVFNKKIQASNILLVNPDLKITLAKAKNAKEARKKSPLLFENIKIKNGNISIFKASKSKYFSVEKLNARIEDIELVDHAEDQFLPVEFSDQEVSGNNFYFRPDNLRIIKADQIQTENNLVRIDQLQIIPLLSYAQFGKYYPKQNSYFQGTISRVELKDFTLQEGKISLNSALISKPNIKLFTYSKKGNKDKKPVKFELNLADLKVTNGQFQILKGENERIFSGSNLQIAFSQVEMNSQTAENKIPFTYENFTIAGSNVASNFGSQNIKIQALSANSKTLQFKNIEFQPINNSRGETAMDGSVKSILVQTNEWNFEKNKLKLDVENVTLDGLNGQLHLGKSNSKKSRNFSGIQFPLLVRKISLKNSNLQLLTGNRPIQLNNLNASIQNLEMNEQTVKNKTPFKIEKYKITSSNFNYKISEFYKATIGKLDMDQDKINLLNINLQPLTSRAQFVRAIPVERDLYDIKINQLTANGAWDFFSNTIKVDAKNVNINGMNANIFRSKVPKDDLTVKPLYSSMLKQIKFPLYIGDLNINNSKLVYEEDTPKSAGPGKLVFGNFNLNAKNINSGKTPGKPTKIPISIRCLLMDSSPLTINWAFDTATTNDPFTISGFTGSVPAANLNLFIEPYLKIRATGNISRLSFDFKGNKKSLSGTFKLTHQNLKVEVLNKKGEKDGVISAVANIFVKSDSGKFPESVLVENIERDQTKSFFNFLWKGLQEGLSTTLLGIGTVAKVETDGKTAAPSKVKEAAKPEAAKMPETKKVEKKEKKGFLEKIFK